MFDPLLRGAGGIKLPNGINWERMCLRIYIHLYAFGVSTSALRITRSVTAQLTSNFSFKKSFPVLSKNNCQLNFKMFCIIWK